MALLNDLDSNFTAWTFLFMHTPSKIEKIEVGTPKFNINMPTEQLNTLLEILRGKQELIR